MTDEIELEFKRFSKEKQEQIKQLVSFATLMGLNGKDLISIGGKLDRIQQRRDKEHRSMVVKEYNVKLIGTDKNFDRRFKVELNGTWYHVINDYYGVVVKNTKTNKQTTVHLSYNDWGRIGWKQRTMNQFLWEFHEGCITLP